MPNLPKYIMKKERQTVIIIREYLEKILFFPYSIMSPGKDFRKFQEALFGKKEARKLAAGEKKIKNYFTKKSGKGSFTGDLVNYGVPAITGAIGGAVGGLAGGVGGVAGSALGAKLGKELIAPKINKAAGFKYGGPVHRTQMALVHEGEFVLPSHIKPTASQRKQVMLGQNGAGIRKPVAPAVMFV